MDIKEIYEAKKQIQEGSLVIWRTRLETLANAGDVRGFLDVIDIPAEHHVTNNCNCPNRVQGCGRRVSGEVFLGEPTITSVPAPE
jgi:hypothetical protein